MSDEGSPRLHIAEGVATIRLCRPAQRNSLHDADLHALLAMFGQLDADPAVRVVVLTADTGGQKRPVFCAGYHVGGFDSEQHDPRLFEKVPDAIERARPITVCALNGSVYGGATDMVLACDLRVALEGCEWRMPAAALGLHYYPSGLQRYVSRLGLQAAKRLFLLAEDVAAAELQRIGYLDTLVAPEALDAEVARLAGLLVANAPLALRGMKQSLNEIARGEFELGHLREREALCAASADLREGLAAFAGKRPPRFQGC